MAVVGQKGRSVHLRGQESPGRAELVEGEDPAGSGHRARSRTSCSSKPATSTWVAEGSGFDRSSRVGSRTPDQRATLMNPKWAALRVAGALDEVDPAILRLPLELGSRDVQGVLDQAVDAHPPAAGVGKTRGAARPDEEAVGRSHQAFRCQGREIETAPLPEAVAHGGLHGEGPFPKEGHTAEDAQTSRRAPSVRGDGGGK